MNYYVLATVCSHTIGIAAIAGLVRFRHVLKGYRPFLLFLVIAWLNEILSSVLIGNGRSNAINSNLYVLVEFLLLLFQFKNWAILQSKGKYYVLLAAIVGIVWIADNLVIYGLDVVDGFFRFTYSIVLVFLSVDQMNHVLLIEQRKRFSDSRIIICCGCLLFYCFRILLESFLVMNLGLSNSFYTNFLLVLVGVNVVTNLIFTAGVICMPTKSKFSVRF